MKTRFKKTTLLLAIVSMLLWAANGNAGETSNVSANSAGRHGHKAPKTQLVSVNYAGTDSGNGDSGWQTKIRQTAAS